MSLSAIFAPGSKGGRNYHCSAPFSIEFHYHLCLVSLVTERKDDIFKGNWHTSCDWNDILLKSLT